MAIRVTWSQDEEADVVFEIPDTAKYSMEQWRLADVVQGTRTITLNTLDPTTGQIVETEAQVPDYVPRYGTLYQMTVAYFVTALVIPALEKFPPAELAALNAAVFAAQEAVRQAREAAIAAIPIPV